MTDDACDSSCDAGGQIDVEGSEWDVLLGIEDRHWPHIRNVCCPFTHITPTPLQIAVEVHDVAGRLDRVCALLRACGFAVTVTEQSTTELHSAGAGPGWGTD